MMVNTRVLCKASRAPRRASERAHGHVSAQGVGKDGSEQQQQQKKKKKKHSLLPTRQREIDLPPSHARTLAPTHPISKHVAPLTTKPARQLETYESPMRKPSTKASTVTACMHDDVTRTHKQASKGEREKERGRRAGGWAGGRWDWDWVGWGGGRVVGGWVFHYCNTNKL